MEATTNQREFYSPSMRALQDRFDGRRLADRLEQVTLHQSFSGDDREFIDGAIMLFLATSDEHGWPDCSYKGGRPGFVRTLSDTELAMAVYDGNSQFRSLGNILANPRVGLLFIDAPRDRRLRVNGTARVVLPEDDPALLGRFPGSVAVITVHALQIFPNCNRYLHLPGGELSPHAPAEGHQPPEADWKSMDVFADVLPRATDPT